MQVNMNISKEPQVPLICKDCVSCLAFRGKHANARTNFDDLSSSSTTETESSETDLAEEELRSLYGYTEEIEAKFQQIRGSDFGRLDDQGCVYLDYTGAMLAPKQLVDQHADLLRSTILGNPHSQNAPSLAATRMDNEARRHVLEFFHASPSEYEVIWTANASAALRIIGEGYPFGRHGAYLYAPDSHNSLLGISEFAKSKNACSGGFGFKGDSLSYDWDDFVGRIKAMGGSKKNNGKARKLIGIPGESNASGLKHNVRRYVDYAHKNGFEAIVDAAALAPTSNIDMEKLGKPNFMSISFYKIFGYPTGIGCLIAKRSSLNGFQKPWFAGGTVRFVGVSSNNVVPLKYDTTRHEMYEDGTINFQATAAVTAGIRFMRDIGMDHVSKHIQFWSAFVEAKLRELSWDNHTPVCYIPQYDSDEDERGHALGVVFLTRTGVLLPHRIIEAALSSKGIAIRTGCFCNPGSAFHILGNHFDKDGKTLNDFVDQNLRFLKSKERLAEAVKKNGYQGNVRVSFGIPTNRADVEALIACIKTEIVAKPKDMEKLSAEYKENGKVPYGLC